VERSRGIPSSRERVAKHRLRNVIDIRPSRESDLPALFAMMNQVIARGDAFVYDEPMDRDDMRRWIGMYPHAFVAESDGQVVGGYFLRPNFPGRGSHVCNAAYMVDEGARGLGVGQAMGEHSLAAAKSLGYTAMQFNAVVSSNGAAVALWRRLGFEVIGTSPRAFRDARGELVDLYIMYRPL
jgi:L-amino acid N-acyltransferase YncA